MWSVLECKNLRLGCLYLPVPCLTRASFIPLRKKRGWRGEGCELWELRFWNNKTPFCPNSFGAEKKRPCDPITSGKLQVQVSMYPRHIKDPSLSQQSSYGVQLAIFFCLILLCTVYFMCINQLRIWPVTWVQTKEESKDIVGDLQRNVSTVARLEHLETRWNCRC